MMNSLGDWKKNMSIDIKKIKVIFFDMGNTLIHFHCGPTDEIKEQLGLDALITFLKNKKNIKLTSEIVQNEFINPWIKIMPLRKIYHKEFSLDEFIDPFLSKLEINLNQLEKIEMMKAFDSGYQKYLYIEKDACEILKILKTKFKIGVISNSASYPEVNIDHFKSLNLDKYIDQFIFSYSLMIGKPESAIFHKALDLFGINADEALMVGDSLAADVQGAKNVNIQTAWLNPKALKNELNINPDIEINSLKQLLEVLCPNGSKY